MINRAFLFVALISLVACAPGSGNSTYEQLSARDKDKFNKYFLQGRDIYNRQCRNCHQPDGRGLRGIIPPLAGSNYLQHNQATIPCLLKTGSSDTLTVNGRQYAPQMPAHNLTNLELAEVLTFINNSWGNEYGFVQVKQVDNWLKNCPPKEKQQH